MDPLALLGMVFLANFLPPALVALLALWFRHGESPRALRRKKARLATGSIAGGIAGACIGLAALLTSFSCMAGPVLAIPAFLVATLLGIPDGELVTDAGVQNVVLYSALAIASNAGIGGLAGLAIGALWPQPSRRQRNICRKCGYDLRGSLEFGRCPECGERFNPLPKTE